MNKDRISYLIENKNKEVNKKHVIYWMQQSMRVDYNHALSYAIDMANDSNLPLLVFFSLTETYLGANLRHYKFMLEGLREVKEKLETLNINFVIKIGKAEETIKQYLEDAQYLIFDYGYLKPQLLWRRKIYNYVKESNFELDLIMIESDVLVPVRTLYSKAAYGAYILRPHLMKSMSKYRDFNKLSTIKNTKKINTVSDFDLNNIEDSLKDFDIDHTVKPYFKFIGGYSEGVNKIKEFLKEKAKYYPDRSDPSLEIQSYLSPYLHFGQISVLEIIDILEKALLDSKINKEVYDSFIEQVVVRRELSFNFVTYVKDYDKYESMTLDWAYKTINDHKDDIREYIYSTEEIEQSNTHDKYFNAAMKEMRLTGYMAGYMRMYWAKKIMEWSNSMEEAFYRLIYLNNKYFLDGRDPNSYASIAWNFGRNDRPWVERDIFGKLRYMNDKGLERKFKINDYLSLIEDLDK